MKLSKTSSVKSFAGAGVLAREGTDTTSSPYVDAMRSKSTPAPAKGRERGDVKRRTTFGSFKFGRRESMTAPIQRSKIEQDVYVNRFIRGFGAGGGRALERMLENSQDRGMFERASEMVVVTTDRVPKYMIRPDAHWKLAWDVFGLFLILFYLFVVPMRLAFSETVPESDAASWSFLNGGEFWGVLDFFTDFYFLVDIAMNFRLAQRMKTGELETDWKTLSGNYIRSWFFPDLIASLPLSIIAPSDGGDASLQKANKLLRIFRVFKLLRLFRLPRILKGLDRNKFFSPSFFRLVRLFVVYFIVVHYVASFYWMVSWNEGFCAFQSDAYQCKGGHGAKPCTVEGDADNKTLAYYRWGGGVPKATYVSGEWETKSILYEPNGYYACAEAWVPWIQILNEPFATQYSQAFFWAMMVTTGIGHDIMPQTDAQTWYTIFATIMGVFLYAFIIGSVPAALEHLDAGKFEHRIMLDKINDYLQNQHVPSFLKKDINDYFDFIQQVNTKGGAHTFRKVLAPLPDSMRLRVKVSLNWKYLRNMDLFKDISPGAVIKVIELLKPYVATPGEHLIVQGSRGGIMFLIKTGKVLLKHESGAVENWKRMTMKLQRRLGKVGVFNVNMLGTAFKNHDEQTISMLMKAVEEFDQDKGDKEVHRMSHTQVLANGSFVGENIALGRPHGHSAVALEYCDLLVLTKERLDTVFQMHGSIRSRMLKTIKSRNDRVRDSKLERRKKNDTTTSELNAELDRLLAEAEDAEKEEEEGTNAPAPTPSSATPTKAPKALDPITIPSKTPRSPHGGPTSAEAEHLTKDVEELKKGQAKLIKMMQKLLDNHGSHHYA
jgi:CRP-like cAMP-binding protein